MDSSIRSLLIAAQKITGQEKNSALLQAYSLLRNVAETKPAVDVPEAFSPDLYVLCAEITFQNGLLDMARECLKMYFMKPPPANQFLCRAYLCQAQLLAPSTTNPEQLEKAVVYLLKAISFAKENPRYHFLVYNASVIYWQFCRPFLKHNFRVYLARSLHAVVKALDDIDDKDYDWRAQLMIALIECNLDAGKKTDAAQIASNASSFIKQNVPHLYKQVFGLIVRNQLIDSSKLHKDIKSSPELAVYYQICKLKVSLENNEQKEYYAEIQRLLNSMGVAHSEASKKTKKGRSTSPSSSIATIDGERQVIDPGRQKSGESRGRRGSLVGAMTRRNSTLNTTGTALSPVPHDILSREVTSLSTEGSGLSELSLPDSISGKVHKRPVRSPDSLRKGLMRAKTSDNLRARSNSPQVRSPNVNGTTGRSPNRGSPLVPRSVLSTGSPDPTSRMSSRKQKSTIKESDRRSPTKGTGRRTPTPVSVKKMAAESQEKGLPPPIKLEKSLNNLKCVENDFKPHSIQFYSSSIQQDKPYLLLELARLCLDLDFPDLAQDCADHMKTCSVKEQGFYLELEFLESDIVVKHLAEKQETLQKNVVDVRLQSMKRCEEAIMNAIRLGDPNVIQVGCVTQWNLCLPLLQPNIRHYVRKPLTQVAEALENIQSLLVELRCQIHTELAKCEEDVEQIEVAMTNLKKALSLDDARIYQERLEVMLHRLELRSELYEQPERVEDIAGMIIEQARKANSGTMRMKRSLLVKAGEALAPDAFLLVLDSESSTKDVTGGKAPTTVIKKLANKARQFNKCVKKSEGHLQRLGNENDRERARLWGDLAKTARKQEVWDVCRVACRFCLQYDDGRWKNIPTPEIKPETTPKPTEKGSKTSESNLGGDTSVSSMDKAPATARGETSRPPSPGPQTSLYDKDLLRMFAEVNFIQGESIVHLLRSEGVQLNDQPIPPVDKSKHPKGYVAKKPEEDPDWIEYCDWIKSLSLLSTSSFLRGLALGVELEEAWLVCCSMTYVWNYHNHILTQLRHREIMATLTTVFDALKKVGHCGETTSLVNVCNALSYALMKPWIPEPSKDPTPAATPSPGESPSPKKGKPNPKDQKSKNSLVAIATEAMPDLKKAIEVCEYAMEVTNGTNNQDVVPILARMPILQTWVTAKQMAQQQITKNLGLDDEPYTEGQRAMSRGLVAVEMLKLNKNGIMEFKETPTVAEVATMIEECRWSDRFVELQMWTQLTSLAYDQKQHNLVVRCSKKALRFAASGTQTKSRKVDSHKEMVEREMLSYSSGLLGQSLIDNMGGKNAIRREALTAFLNAARFAATANNYEQVMTAARHYWNACCPLVSQPIERELLREPIRMILQCISDTAEKQKKKEEKGDGDDVKSESDPGAGPEGDKKEEKTVGGIGAVEDDLTLRAALYGVLFQSFADKGEWETGLAAMDQAITDMPRTKHRLLIFKHRVMTKAKLGRSVSMDIQKFKDESEDYVAHMWRRVALSSKETAEQLLSYQNAIEALNSQSNEWLKIELLLEFGQWMCVKDFPLVDCVDQIEWAVDIMLNMQAEVDAKKEQELRAQAEAAEAKKAAGKGKKAGKGPPPKPKIPSPKARTPEPDPKAIKKGEGEETGSEVNAEGIVPVAKEAVIGVDPTNIDLKVQDVTDIKILDGLVRAHVLIAEIMGRGVPQYADYLLMAHAYLMKLWQVTVTVSGPTMKEILKNPPAAAEKEVNKGSAKKKDKGAEKAPAKEKPKRKGPLDILPSTVEEWAVYDVPDEVIEAFKHDLMTDSGINKHTIVKPMLSLNYLESLVSQLCDIGYNHLTLPVLAFEDLMSRDLLQNDGLRFLVHTRALEVCLELNLNNGYTFHEKICGNVVINENDLAKSRDEIAIWKEKQSQVIKEEMRVRETIAKLASETQQSRKSFAIKPQTVGSVGTQSEEKMISHLGKVLGAVQFRDVWTDTAEILIRQGHYQSAREFLNEAYSAAVAFDDPALQARVMYLLASLSYEEAQYGQTINICKKAQAMYHGDEMFWYKTTVLMVDATLRDYENRKAKRVARGIIVHSLNEFLRIQDERPNRSSVMGFIIAMLQVRHASTQWSIIQEECPDINDPSVMKRVHEICEKYDEGVGALIRLGYKREALPLMQEHARVLHKMAKESIEKEIRHTYYLQGMIVLKDAVTTAEEVLLDVQTLFTLQEIRGMSLPIQREVADIKIACAQLMLEIFNEHCKEIRNKQLDDIRKGSVLKMVEDFIRATPDYTHMEKDWVETVKTVIEDAVIKFLDAHNLAGNIPKLKAKAMCGLGQCLRALAFHQSSDPPTQWIVHEMELAKLSNISEEGENESQDTEEDKHTRQFLKYAKQIREYKVSDGVSRHYLVQATECLLQALNVALNKKYNDIAACAALELVECFGQYDPGTSSQFLALYQSCHVSLRLEDLLHKAQLDPIQSKLAALLRQRQNLLSREISYNMSNSVVMTSIQSALETDWQSWKKMDILSNHLEISKEFPANFNFIILQHNPDKSFLYGAVLDKPKSSLGGGDKKGNPKQAAPVASKAKVFGMETSGGELEHLLTKCREHRQNVQQLLVKQEYQRSQAAMRQKMLQNLDDSVKGQKKTLVDESENEERHLQDEFRDLVMAVEMYLKPITTQLDGFMAPSTTSPSTSTTEKPGREPKEPPAPPQEYAIVLADPELLELPLEAVRVLQAESIVSLSRDFSLQVFYHRYHQDSAQANISDKKKGEKGKGGQAGHPKSGGSASQKGSDDAAAAAKKAKAKGADQPFSRIPGLRDASKKMAKIIPLNRPGNAWNIPVDTMNFRYIVDPHLDCAETEENKPIEVFNKILETYEQQFTPRWLGVSGEEHSPSVGEWEIYLIENSSFIFYGMERLLSYLPPAKLSALNIPDCMIVYLLDMAQTTKSFTRQSKIDVLKSSKILALEKPVETAMLTTLTGVKCIMGNQWHCTLAENAMKLNTSMKDILEGGMSTGESVRMLFTPYRRKIPISEEGEAETGEDGSEGGRGEDGAGDGTDRSVGSEKTATTVEYRENIDIQRSWYNLVCYGLPNLIVSQL